MNEQRLARINELYHKSKNEGLSEEEKVEQAQLRADYIADVRTNLRGTLEQVTIVYPDGTSEKASDRKKSV